MEKPQPFLNYLGVLHQHANASLFAVGAVLHELFYNPTPSNVSIFVYASRVYFGSGMLHGAVAAAKAQLESRELMLHGASWNDTSKMVWRGSEPESFGPHVGVSALQAIQGMVNQVVSGIDTPTTPSEVATLRQCLTCSCDVYGAIYWSTKEEEARRAAAKYGRALGRWVRELKCTLEELPSFWENSAKLRFNIERLSVRLDLEYATALQKWRNQDQPGPAEEEILIGQVLTQLDIDSVTLNRYCKKAGVATPGRGGRYHRFKVADVRKVCQAIGATAKASASTRDAAAKMLKDIDI